MKIITITGSRNSGKTLLLQELVDYLKSNKINYDGIISLPILINDVKIGFDALRLSNCKVSILCRNDYISTLATSHYSFNQNVFTESQEIINNILSNQINILIIDEIGILEMRDEGWAELLNIALNSFAGILILTLRKNLAIQITDKYNIKNDFKIDIDEIGLTESRDTLFRLFGEF